MLDTLTFYYIDQPRHLSDLVYWSNRDKIELSKKIIVNHLVVSKKSINLVVRNKITLILIP